MSNGTDLLALVHLNHLSAFKATGWPLCLRSVWRWRLLNTVLGKGSWIPSVDEGLSGTMSNSCPDCLEGWDHSIPINRLDTSWSLSLCPLYMTLNLGCATSCLISHFVALLLTVRGSDWGDPLEIRLEKAALMDETSSHLQSFPAIPVSSLSPTPSTLLLTSNNFTQRTL